MRVLRPAWFAGDDRPVPVQLADELQAAFLHADLGRQWAPPENRVADVIRRGLPADLSLLGGATAFGVVAGAAGGADCAAGPRAGPPPPARGGAGVFIFPPRL